MYKFYKITDGSMLQSYAKSKEIGADDLWLNITDVLYHGTTKANYERIKKAGKISAGNEKLWNASKACVYLSNDKDTSYEYVNRVSDDDIVVLAIDTNKLNNDKIKPDENEEPIEIEDGLYEVYAFEYYDSIPLNAVIQVYEE